MNYPTKTTQFGNYISTYDVINDNLIETMKKTLKQQYELIKSEIERDGNKIFCRCGEIEWIIKKGYPKTTVGYEFECVGRACYMQRLINNYGRIYARHPNKKNVPKGKRGKKNLKKYILGIKNNSLVEKKLNNK